LTGGGSPAEVCAADWSRGPEGSRGGYVVRLIFRVRANVSGPKADWFDYLPLHRGAWDVANHIHSGRCSRFRAGGRFRAAFRHQPMPPRGEIPDRFRGCWLRRSPPRPSTLLAPGPSRSLRSGAATCVSMCARPS